MAIVQIDFNYIYTKLNPTKGRRQKTRTNLLIYSRNRDDIMITDSTDFYGGGVFC